MMVRSKSRSTRTQSAMCESLESRRQFSSTVGLDTSFAGGSLATHFYATGNEAATGVVTLKDGRVLVAGSAEDPDVGTHVVFAVYDKTGKLSKSFDGDGKRILSFADSELLGFDPTVKLLKDGNVLVVGIGHYMKLKLDGTTDTTFGKKGFANQPDTADDYYGSIGGLEEETAVLPDGSIRYSSYNSEEGLLRVANYSANGAVTSSLRRTISKGGDLTLTPTAEVIAYDYSSTVKVYRPDLSIDSKFGKGGTIDVKPAFAAWVKANGPFTQDNDSDTPELTQLVVLPTKAGYVFTSEVYSTSPKVPFVPFKFGHFTLVNFYVGNTGQTVSVTGSTVDGTKLLKTNFTTEPQTSDDPDTVLGTFNVTNGKTVVFKSTASPHFDNVVDYSAAGDGKYYVVGYTFPANGDDEFVVGRTAYVG